MNGVGNMVLFLCVARLFYASDLFVRYLPMPLADGSQTADLFRERTQMAVFRWRCFVSSSMGRRVAHSCLFSFRWGFLAVARGCSLSCVPLRTDH